ncbi:MAG: hypothetical protein K8U03_08985 [Planctomycetia bacterium]|nr:hypothetical protein [Planctomycetia bacterium]
MARRKQEDPSPVPVIWHCVLDREHRLLYLGNNEAEALAALIPGAIMRSAPRMGDAQSAAAIAVSAMRNSG